MIIGLQLNLWKRNGLMLIVFFAVSITSFVYASDCTIIPALPKAGHLVTVEYDPIGGPLASASSVYIHRGINNWEEADTDVSMSLSNGLWMFTYLCPQMADRLDYAFHDGGGTWDTNGGADWHFAVPLPGVGDSPPIPVNVSKAHVMMQGFYWDCPSGWYSTMADNASNLRFMQGGQGIDRIWFPPPQKSDSGGFSMGYDPYDYYDLGQYHQKGTTPTHFGTQADLKNTLAAYQSLGIVCMADIVLNHRSGGESESNPNLGGASSWTDFSGVASGKCIWHHDEFHPSSHETSDEGTFAVYPDVCHVTGNSEGSAYFDLIDWGGWLQDSANAGFDGGWRFDYVKGIHPSFMADFRIGTGNAFGILECWDTIEIIESYVKYTGNSLAFDFPGYFTMADIFNNGSSLTQLVDTTKVYAARSHSNAVTFVANHDTDVITNNKMLAYAFILTYHGYPCIFWKDYFDGGLATLGGQAGNGIDPLVWVRGALGGGEPEIQLLKTNSDDLLIYGSSNGSSTAPGYIVVINNHDSSTKGGTVTTSNSYLRGKTLECHAWYSYVGDENSKPSPVSCSAGGVVSLQAPPRGYAVYSVSTALPSPWMTQDIGAVGIDGHATFIGDNYTLTASGGDIQGSGDEFRYAYQTMNGNCAIQARVVNLEPSDPWAKAGVMIRQGTANDAMNATVLMTPENGVVFQWRTATGGVTDSVFAGGLTAPCWVKLVRSENTFSGYYSTNGTIWSMIGNPQTVNMSANAKIGLVLTSHNNGELATGTMNNVDLNSEPVVAPIADQFIVAGGTLSLTNSASDADVPPQTLTYELINPPIGAAINTTNGMFSWRPLIEQSPSTQTVALVVFDDGVPLLGSTRTFTVTVGRPAKPTMSSSEITNGQFGFSIYGDAGPDYTILTTTNLNTDWTSDSTLYSPIPPFFWIDTNQRVSPSQFYRIQLEP